MYHAASESLYGPRLGMKSFSEFLHGEGHPGAARSLREYVDCVPGQLRHRLSATSIYAYFGRQISCGAHRKYRGQGCSYGSNRHTAWKQCMVGQPCRVPERGLPKSDAAAAKFRVISDCHFVGQLNRFTPKSLTLSVPGVLQTRRYDRNVTLAAAGPGKGMTLSVYTDAGTHNCCGEPGLRRSSRSRTALHICVLHPCLSI
jgi:hypothetical protein